MPRTPISDATELRKILETNKISTMDQLKDSLGTTGTMTIYRLLKQLGYRSSYSHRGKYYTLEKVARFNEVGLWSHQDVWFSQYGNLVETAKELIDVSQVGFTTEELETVVGVNPKQALLRLFRDGRIHREELDGVYVYVSNDVAVRRKQTLSRREQPDAVRAGEVGRLSDEIRAAIILFFSVLDEKQRRLYAGLESQKLGNGGDSRIAELFGMDVHTVAKGRRELFNDQIESTRVRRAGGGRKTSKKKHPK